MSTLQQRLLGHCSDALVMVYDIILVIITGLHSEPPSTVPETFTMLGLCFYQYWYGTTALPKNLTSNDTARTSGD